MAAKGTRTIPRSDPVNIKLRGREMERTTGNAQDGQEDTERTKQQWDWRHIHGGVQALRVRLKCERPTQFMKMKLLAKMFGTENEVMDVVAEETVDVGRCDSVSHTTEDEENDQLVVQTIRVRIPDILPETRHILFSIQSSSSKKSLTDIKKGTVTLESCGEIELNECLWDFQSPTVEGNEAWIMMMKKTENEWYYCRLVMPANQSHIDSILTDSADLGASPRESTFPDDRHLFVRVLGGEGLPAKDFKLTKWNTSDPFYVIHFKGQKKFRSRVCQDTLRPKWDERPFDLGLLATDGTDKLEIEIYDHDTATPDDFMGYFWMLKRDLCRISPRDNKPWYPLSPSKNGGVSHGQSPAGQIQLEITRLSTSETPSS